MKPLNPLYCALLLLTPLHADATARKYKIPQFDLIDAYTRSDLPGRSDGTTNTTTQFIVIWRDSSFPETFAWRANNKWAACKTEKIHAAPASKTALPKGINYTIERTTRQQIKAGDTLLITSLMPGSFTAPPALQKVNNNTIALKTGSKKWAFLSVKKIEKKPGLMKQ